MIEPIYPDRWIEQHAGVIFRTCRRITSSEDAAWEAFQETCLAFAKRKDSLDLSMDPGPWLKETARRCSKAVVRRESNRDRRQEDQTIDAIPSESVTQIDTASLQEAVTALHEELDLLSREDRDLLQCLYVEGMTHLNTARHLRCSTGSVHSRAERVRGQLRRKMERRGIAVGMLLLLFLLNQDAEACCPRLIATPAKKPILLKIAAITALSMMGAISLSAANDPAGPKGTASSVADDEWHLQSFEDDTTCEIDVDFGYEDDDQTDELDSQQVMAGQPVMSNAVH